MASSYKSESVYDRLYRTSTASYSSRRLAESSNTSPLKKNGAGSGARNSPSKSKSSAASSPSKRNSNSNRMKGCVLSLDRLCRPTESSLSKVNITTMASSPTKSTGSPHRGGTLTTSTSGGGAATINCHHHKENTPPSSLEKDSKTKSKEDEEAAMMSTTDDTVGAAGTTATQTMIVGEKQSKEAEAVSTGKYPIQELKSSAALHDDVVDSKEESN